MPTSASPVRAVLFDYGLVLTGPADPAAWERMKQILGADEPSFFRAYWEPRHDYDRGALNGDTYWRRVAALLGKDLSAADHRRLVDADTDLWTAPNEPMIAWAAALQRAGIPTGILSNIGDAIEQGVLERCDWLSGFAHHTFSHRLGIAKPEAAIYAHAAQGLGIPPEQILFIDDRADNIQAARSAGMQTVLYSTHEAFLQSMQSAGLEALLHPAPNGVATPPSLAR